MNNKVKVTIKRPDGSQVEVSADSTVASEVEGMNEIIRMACGICNEPKTEPDTCLKPSPKAKPTAKPKASAPKRKGARPVSIGGSEFDSIGQAAKHLHVGEKRIRKAIREGGDLDGRKVVAL